MLAFRSSAVVFFPLSHLYPHRISPHIDANNNMSSPPPPPPAQPPKPASGVPTIRLNLSAAAAAAASNRPTSSAGSTAAAAAQPLQEHQQPQQPSPAAKRRRYTPVALPPASYTASAWECNALHQRTRMHFYLHQPVTATAGGNSSGCQWYCGAQSSLYLTLDNNDASSSLSSSSSSSSSTVLPMALHLRGSCHVTSVQVECLAPPPPTTTTGSKQPQQQLLTLQPLRTSYHHADPLQHVLIKPAASYTEEDIAQAAATAAAANNNNDNNKQSQQAEREYRFDADAQSSRGAAGMTTGLRAASIASNMGELRVSCEMPPSLSSIPKKQEEGEANDCSSRTLELAQAAWKAELESFVASEGRMVRTLRQELQERSTRREARIALVASRLAKASYGNKSSSSSSGNSADNSSNVKLANRAFKVTVKYNIPLHHSSIVHLAGLHAHTTDQNPHIYTTTGVFGDHEGPRSWLPCLDSAASKHRATHEITIHVTAPLRQGISCLGLGQDFGCQQAVMHDYVVAAGTWKGDNMEQQEQQQQQAQLELGTDHVEFLRQTIASTTAQAWQQQLQQLQAHVIPLETNGMTTSLDAVQVTSIWCSNTWKPVPARSLGFAIGPFKVLEDPEYFGPAALVNDVDGNNDDDEEEEQEKSMEERLQELLAALRKNGEGIRQAYFAPIFERKFLHANASTVLMPDTEIQLLPLTASQIEQAEAIDKTIQYSTVGVPHRAMSLMRDVLALPSYRTSSYTQIWIPNAVQGGCSSGALHSCPEVLVNPFLGGAIMDSRLLPPVGSRLPFHQGGRVLQFLQARSAIRGWITAAVPLGGRDDVGMGYIHSLIESFVMSMYERGHGAWGEGGAKGSIFFSQRYSMNSGLNSLNLDFLPVQNIEELDVVIEGVGAVSVEDRHNEQLWRSARNGTESHTSGVDEFNLRQLLLRDAVEALERGTDKDKNVPTPSMGWFGSHLSLSFLSSTATSSSDLGCGALELLHPVGGLVYRSLKSEALRGVVEGRAGVANFLRLVRATFIASHLDDTGETQLKLPTRRDRKQEKSVKAKEASASSEPSSAPVHPFVLCVNEILKKKGLSHTLFTRALRNLSGRLKEPQLLGTLVDVERHAEDPRTHRPFVDPEGFPNSYIRGASMLYCRVGVHVEPADGVGKDQGSSVAKGTQVQVYAEPVIPEGGIAYGGPITIRVIENEGQFREYVRELSSDGSRRDWGSIFLHAKPVTLPKAQTAASGTLESSKDALKPGSAAGAFTESQIHRGGYQAIELIRLTNLTPLLWVRIDPMGLYGGKTSVFLPDACLAEQIFHDGDAGAQVDAIRALAERPLRIQGSMKATAIYDVNVSELPVRVLGDCLRGSPALHSSLPHTPVVRTQAALAIAQWQNNKAPQSKDAVGADWVGMNLLMQYFRERFYSSSIIMPMKFSRLALKKSEASGQTTAATETTGGTTMEQADAYQYLDALQEGEERATALDESETVEIEEDEEYRVRSMVITAIACLRARDGLSPPQVIKFLENILESEDAEMVGHLVYPDEELTAEKTFEKMKSDEAEVSSSSAGEEAIPEGPPIPSLSYVSSMLIADALLALCHVNARPEVILDPATGKQVQTSGVHPLSRLIKAARGWLDWELYRERIRTELASSTSTGVSGNCHNSISSCAVLALANLAILKQSTVDPTIADEKDIDTTDIYSAKFYIEIFDSKPPINDPTKAACAQAVACICCASDRLEKEDPAVDLLHALEFLLDRISDKTTSPSLRHTLALIMMDACTGKVCSMQRVGAIAGRNDLITATARFMNGPLGASHGGDNGSAMLVAVSSGGFPAANAVNDGARRGLRVLSRAGHPRETIGQELVVRVGQFATKLWRMINGEPANPVKTKAGELATGVCAYDGILRTSLLSLWQWLWPKGCFAVLQVQSWKSHEGTQRYRDIGAHLVMKVTDDEKAAAAVEENSLADLNRLVNMELDRQAWRGEMAKKAYELSKFNKTPPVQDVAAAEQGIGQPLPPIQRDTAFKQGGWIASAAQQRRALALDGGTAVTKLRLKVKSSSDA